MMRIRMPAISDTRGAVVRCRWVYMVYSQPSGRTVTVLEALGAGVQEATDGLYGPAVPLGCQLEARGPDDPAGRFTEPLDAEFARVIADRQRRALHGVAIEMAAPIECLEPLDLVGAGLGVGDSLGSGPLAEHLRGLEPGMPVSHAVESAYVVPQGVGVQRNGRGLGDSWHGSQHVFPDAAFAIAADADCL